MRGAGRVTQTAARSGKQAYAATALRGYRLGSGRVPAAGLRASASNRRFNNNNSPTSSPSGVRGKPKTAAAAVPAKLAVNESRGWNPQRMVREILHEDDRVIVLNKGYGMTVQVRCETHTPRDTPPICHCRAIQQAIRSPSTWVRSQCAAQTSQRKE